MRVPPQTLKELRRDIALLIAVANGEHMRSAALVAESRVLCHPASVDSIPSSAGREDHVSMGWHAARKLRQA